MSKELEALERVLNKFVEILLETKCEKPTAVNITYLVSSLRVAFHNELDIIETALKRIPKLEKEIEDAHDMHKAYAMAIEKHIKDENEYIQWVQEGGYDKTEVQAFEIIKEKRVDVDFLYSCFTNEFDDGGLSRYNSWKRDGNYYLTQEEFDLLKECF